MSAEPRDYPREHFAAMGRKSAEARRGGLVLTRAEAEALVAAYELIRRAAMRARRKIAAPAAAGRSGEEGQQ